MFQIGTLSLAGQVETEGFQPLIKDQKINKFSYTSTQTNKGINSQQRIAWIKFK